MFHDLLIAPDAIPADVRELPRPELHQRGFLPGDIAIEAGTAVYMRRLRMQVGVAQAIDARCVSVRPHAALSFTREYSGSFAPFRKVTLIR